MWGIVCQEGLVGARPAELSLVFPVESSWGGDRLAGRAVLGCHRRLLPFSAGGTGSVQGPPHRWLVWNAGLGARREPRARGSTRRGAPALIRKVLCLRSGERCQGADTWGGFLWCSWENSHFRPNFIPPLVFPETGRLCAAGGGQVEDD